MTATVTIHHRLIFSGPLPVWLAVALVIAAAVLVVWLLRRELRGRAARRLYIIRALIVVALGLLVLQPVLYRRREVSQPATVLLLADRSRSMLRSDAWSGSPLLDLATALKLPGLEDRETLPGLMRHELDERHVNGLRWQAQVADIHDVLTQGLPWSPSFAVTIQTQAIEIQAFANILREENNRLGALETRLKSVTPDSALFATVARFTEKLTGLEKAGTAPDQSESRLQSCTALLAEWDATRTALASLQDFCDARFLEKMPAPIRESLQRMAKQSRFDLAHQMVTQLAEDKRVRLQGWETLTTEKSDAQTDLYALIDTAASACADETLAGIVLISDGQQNLPDQPESMHKLTSRSIPFLGAGVGLTNEIAEVAIVNYDAPGVVLRGKPVEVTAELKATLPAGTDFEVLLSQGETSLARQSLKADGSGSARCKLSFRAPDKIETPLTLSVAARSVRIPMRVLDQEARVLIITPSVNWDLVHLLRSLAGKPCRVDVASWNANKESRGTGFGKIPDKLSAFKRYQLVVLDGPPFPSMKGEDNQLFADYVTKEGGTLFLITPVKGDGYFQRFSSALGVAESAPSSSKTEVQPPSRVLEPTAAYAPVSLAADPAQSLGLWRSLRAPMLVHPVPAQVVTLLACGGSPCLSLGFPGKGKVYLLGCNDLYRLREWDGGDAAQRFLAHLFDDALEPALLASAKVAVYPSTPSAGAMVHLIADGVEAVQLTLPGEKPTSLKLNGRHSTFRVPQPGFITVEAQGAPPLKVEVIASVAKEDIDVRLDEARFRRLAAEAGGRYVALADLPRVLKSLPSRTQTTVTVREFRLWNFWFLLPLIAALMTLDWYLRRKQGLVL